jgi:hypothetical protein
MLYKDGKGLQRANAQAFKLTKDKHSTLFDLFVSDNIYYLCMSSGAANVLQGWKGFQRANAQAFWPLRQ